MGTTLQRHIAEREYRSSAKGARVQAPNRRHNLRTYFTPTGVVVHDRTAPDEPRLLGMQLVGMGRGSRRLPVPPGRVVSMGARVEIRRPDVVEWYVNSPAGLEQGFTLARRLPAEGPLVLELALLGSKARRAGSEVRIQTPKGRELLYDKLVALDAKGSVVPSRLEVAAVDRIALVVNDAEAVYPLTIDPLLTALPDSVLDANQSLTLFGTSVAGAGDVNGDGFDDVIVGAEEYDDGSINEGAAFLFLGSAAGIADAGAMDADTVLQGDQSGALFGTAVAGAGDVNGDGYDDVIIGAQEFDNGEVNEGAAFIYLGGPDGVPDGNPSTADTMLESDQPGSLFGGSVAGAGDVNGDGYDDVIVGVEEWNGPSIDEGAAVVFHGSANGIADANMAAANARFESNQVGALLGVRVAGAGDVNGDGYDDVLIGAELYDNGHTDEGAAFLLLGSASGISSGDPSTADAQFEADQGSSFLGGAVAGAGDVNGDGYDDIIVGADSHDAGTFNEGVALLFYGSAAGISDGNPSTPGVVQFESNQQGTFFGGSVASAGDVNGDGYGDVIVGAPQYDSPDFNEGSAFVFLGSASGIANGNPDTADFHLEGDQINAQFGGSVAGAGDVNGDGSDDLIVGADLFDNGTGDEGGAFVFLPEPSESLLLAVGLSLLLALAAARRA